MLGEGSQRKVSTVRGTEWVNDDTVGHPSATADGTDEARLGTAFEFEASREILRQKGLRMTDVKMAR